MPRKFVASVVVLLLLFARHWPCVSFTVFERVAWAGEGNESKTGVDDKTAAGSQTVERPVGAIESGVERPEAAPARSRALDKPNDRKASENAPLRFRRVFVPEAQLQEASSRGVRYLPIEGVEFQRLLDRASRQSDSQTAPTEAEMGHATYEARLVDDDLVDGKATLDIVHVAMSPVLLSLDPCRLAIGPARWLVAPDTKQAAAQQEKSLKQPPPLEAIVGAGADGKLAVRVARSGQLSFDWTLRGQRETGGARTFLLQLPTCPSNRLRITLPADLVPVVEPSIAMPAVIGATASTTRSDGAAPEHPPEATNVWEIELGGQNQAVLRIAKHDAIRESRPLTLVRPVLTYEFSPLGMQVSAEIKLDVLGEPIREIPLLIERPLSLVAARCGDAPLVWSEELASESKESPPPVDFSRHPGARRVVLRLPESIHGTQRVLRLTAVAPLPDRGRLPLIRPGGKSLVWQEGSASLIAPLPLQIDDLQTHGCRQTKAEPLASPARGEMIGLQFFQPDADVDIVLGRQADHFEARCATAIDARGSTIGGRFAADLRAIDGECFSLEARVAASWIVDSVESTPPNLLSGWTQESLPEGIARIRLTLNRAIRGDRPARLTLSGRWRRPPRGESLKLDDMEMVHLLGIKTVRQVVALHAGAPYRLEMKDDGLAQRLDIQQLDAADVALLPGLAAGSTLFVASGAAPEMAVTIGTETPHFAGDVHLDVRVGNDTLTETYTFSCSPESTEIDRLLIKFSGKQSEPLVWSLGGAKADASAAGGVIAARRLSAEAQAILNILPSPDLWEVSFAQPRGKPFAFQAVRVVPLSDSTPLALAALAQAESQRGTVEIRSVAELRPAIENRRLKPSLSPPETVDRWSTTIATFAYEPQEEVTSSAPDAPPALTIAPGTQKSDCWAWSERLDSHYSPDGRCQHVALWRIENTGRETTTLTMPTDASLQAIWVDGELIQTGDANNPLNKYTVELPRRRRFPTIVVKWSDESPRLGIASYRTAVTPQLNIPVLARQVNIWLPPQFRLIGGQSEEIAAADEGASWTQRLFGPLARSASQPIFDPSRRDQWTDLADRVAHSDPASLRSKQLEQLLESLATRQSSAHAPRESSTWGELLGAAEAEAVAPGGGRVIPLLIDREALADVGITARTIVPIVAASSEDSTASVLGDADLTLLVDSRAILLTTRSAAARWREQDGARVPGVVTRVASSDLARRIQSAVTGGSERFVTGEVWSFPDLKLPWSSAFRDPREVDHAGWTQYRLDAPGAGPWPVFLVWQDAVVGIGCIVFLSAALLTWMQPSRGIKFGAAVIAAVTAAALAVPVWLTPIGSGAWLGLVLGWVIKTLWRSLAASTETTDSSTGDQATKRTRASVAKATVAVALLIAISIASDSGAAETAPAPGASPIITKAVVQDDTATVHDVLIPVDAQQNPTGTSILVPEPLYIELSHRVSHANDAGGDWLISAATYRGSLARDAETFALGAENWTARYELETFAGQVVVQIPFGGEGTNLVPDGVRLDGHPAPFESSSLRRTLACRVSEAGPHRLELIFRPTPVSSAGATTIDLPILPLASSHLILEAPAGPTIDIPSAHGTIERDPKSSRLTCALGDTDRLTVRWGDPSAGRTRAAVTDVEELMWFKARPGSVALEARFNVQVADGKLQQLRLLADPRLRHLPLESGSPISQIRVESGDPNVISLGLARPVSDRVSFTVAFLLSDATGVGNLRLPRLEIAGARSTTRRVAVSIDPALEADERQLTALKAGAGDSFLTTWGSAEAKPQFAFPAPENDSAWSLSIHSREPKISSIDSLAVVCQRAGLAISWQSELSVRGGAVFQVRLPADKIFYVESAALRAPGAPERPIHWSRGASGEITLFLSGPPADRYKLIVRGTLPYPKTATIDAPSLHPEGAALESRSVLVFRRPEMQATVAAATNMTALDPAETQLQIERAIADGWLDESIATSSRAVACLQSKNSGPSPTIRVNSNAPRVEATQRITARRDGENWAATSDLELKVSGGVLDVLRFELPRRWSTPTEISPPMSSSIVDVPGENRKQLILRPAEPISGSEHIRLSGPIATGSGQAVRVPDIRPLEIGSLRRYVLLPTNSGDRQLTWETRGVNVEPLPSGFASGTTRVELYRTCQVIGQTFEATLKSVQRLTERPRVRLADLRLTFADQQTGFGVATFDLEPAGTTTCVLQMPAPYQLVHVRANDLPAAVKQVGPNQWRLSTGDGKLPQRVEAIFQFDHSTDAPGERAGGTPIGWPPAPTLLGYSVDQAIWTIAGGPRGAVEVDRSARPIDALTREQTRLDAMSKLLEAAGNSLADISPEGIASAYVPWARRLIVARGAVERERIRASLTPDRQRAIDSQTREIDEFQAKLARKLGTWNLLSELSAQRAVADNPGNLWRLIDRQPQSFGPYILAGASTTMPVRYSSTATNDWLARFATAIAGACAVGAIAWLSFKPAVIEIAARWPQWLGVLAGLSWWLWLAPSWLGLIIVAGSCIASFRLAVARRRVGPGASDGPLPAISRSAVASASTSTKHFDVDGD